jgi:hypothetical protein
MSSDDEGAGGLGARLVELPSTAKKPKRMPFVRTQVWPGSQVPCHGSCTPRDLLPQNICSPASGW